MQENKICILGAGPGGATAALHLAKAGIPSMLIDKAVFPRDKVCGDALSGKVVSELNRIGADLSAKLALEQERILPCWGINFVSPDFHSLRVPIRPNYNPATDTAPGFISKRIHFDNFLINEVKKHSCIQLLENTAVGSFKKTNAGFDLLDDHGNFISNATLLIDASGAQSPFSRKVAGLPQEPAHYCAGLRAYYKNVKGLDEHNFLELHFFQEFLPGYLWIFPLANGEANIGVGMLSRAVKKNKINLKKALLQMLETHPRLKDRFADATLMGDIKGFGLPLGSKRRSISGDHYMLTGDAASLIDPFSGEGISNAMISGRWAAAQAIECLQTNDFSAAQMTGYDKRVYNRLGKELKISYAMQRMLTYPWLFNFVARKASNNPQLAETLSCMFLDLDMREKLKKPGFYLSLLKG